MFSPKKSQQDLLDILFENRNKAYGAYELRTNYARRAKKAMTGIVLFSIMLASVPLIAGLIEAPPVHHPPQFTDSLVIHSYEAPPELPAIAPQPEPVSVPEANTNPTLPVDIVDADDIKEPVVRDPTPSNPTINPDGNGKPGLHPMDDVGGGGGGGNVPVADVITDPEMTYESFDIAQQPEFPGGEDALMEYLSANIHYPKPALNNNVEGKVTIGFVVNKDGEIEDIKILRGLGYGCDEEAMRVIANMPKWKPGKNNGKPVSVYFNVPLVFELRQ